MAIIGTVFKTESIDGYTVRNIPYYKHDHPCDSGCCENELSIGAGTAIKVSWLLDEYMPKNNVKDIDFEMFEWYGFKF